MARGSSRLVRGEGMKVNINDRQPRFDEGKEREMLRQYLELQTWERMSQAQRNRWWEIEQFRAREPHTITAGDPRGARTKGEGMSDRRYELLLMVLGIIGITFAVAWLAFKMAGY